ncbi:MAG: enoyl-CoA hydratase/isomerase family protein [Alphaproteobacteria bacterium]|nr:enoyl-CoA hydratase/isomerase family protein [Alphaproteobacteria bacterium]
MSDGEAAAALVLREDDGPITTLTLNRPDRRNALSGALVEALIAALGALRAEDDVRAIVLTGAGSKAFCAGGDLAGGMMGEGATDAWRGRGRFADLMLAVHQVGRPVIAAVNGDALGGGFGLAVACDMVVVADDARLGTPEIKVGLFPMMILAELLRTLPRKLLCEMIYTGRFLQPDEALRYGVVNRVAPRAEVRDAAMALAGQVARYSPAVLRLGKDALHQAEDLALEPALRFLHGRLEANLVTEDAMEGISAFMARREPTWRGR